ncbi:endonuclease exonuclease phosphatase family protein [Phlyctema vagabunda]|uniref:Endonuclease exonuclease phosphatase family protein n=1 Tax=Phlyctema vagabunda TaxID=108571 RepID=A0ABR4PH75_9HELO
MALFSRIHTQYLSWSQNTPLPADASSVFQTWHQYDLDTERWIQIVADKTQTGNDSPPTTAKASKFVIATWNIDFSSALPGPRIAAILSHILKQTRPPDIIFFQEVSLVALKFLLDDSRIRESWFSSEAGAANWDGQSFATMTLLAKSRFATTQRDAAAEKAVLGPVWRVQYPTRFGRDALCCDIFIPSSHVDSVAPRRVRLINVHLDSLPIQPSHRPRQISTLAALLRSAGAGLVAGDFNPVLPEDASLVEDSGLVDAWVALRGQGPGHTWGIDGKQPFPPIRLDKVALLGLDVQNIEVMHPDVICMSRSSDAESTSDQQHQHRDVNELVPWSDHSGLKCSFGVVNSIKA